jgi:hypothetical protein
VRSLLACFVFVAACGARTSTPPPHHQPRTRPPTTTPPPNPSGPSEPECDELYTHAFALVIADRQPPPPEADRVALRGELRPGFIADCRGGTRDYYQCGLSAKSGAELGACKR